MPLSPHTPLAEDLPRVYLDLQCAGEQIVEVGCQESEMEVLDLGLSW